MGEVSPELQKGLQDYIEYYERLSPRTIRLIEKIAAPNIRFKDPFNDVAGVDAVERIFEHMFANVQKPKFKVLDYGWAERMPAKAFLRWDFSYEIDGNSRKIYGTSEVEFNDKGQVIVHTDFWDAGEYFYEHIPLLGAAIRFVKSKLKV